MNSTLFNHLSTENVLSYSQACIDICSEFLTLKDEDFKRIIIPSRGAYPFYIGSKTALRCLTDSKFDLLNFELQFTTWLLPFTSDWGHAKINVSSKQMRKFWVRVLADCLRQTSSPYSGFYEDIIDTVGKNLTINTSQLKLKNTFGKNSANNEKFIFIDTVVSGQAICEIIEAFYDFDLVDFYIIAIIDNSGSQLKKEYKDIIEREKSRGKLKQIYVKKIYSEDASPLLNSGISSIVFPSLIESAINDIPEFRHNNFVGGGIWFIDSISHLRSLNPNLNFVRAVINQFTFSGVRHLLDSKNPWFSDQVTDNVEQIISKLGNFNIFDQNMSKDIIYDRIRNKDSDFDKTIDVSSSHVIRIGLDEKIIGDIIKRTKKI